MRAFLANVIGVSLALLLSVGCAEDKSASQSAEAMRGIRNGTEINSSTEQSVGAVLSYFSNGGRGTCSGTLLSPRVVLTAAHCLYHLDEVGVIQRATSVLFTRKSDTSNLNSSNSTKVIQFILPQGFEQIIFSAPALNDYALLVLESSVTADAYPTLASNSTSIANGTSLTVVGYGRDETELSGVRRTGAMTFRGWIQDAPIPTLGQTRTPMMILERSASGQSTCSGDSGGPAFLRANGVFSLVGITHAGYGNTCQNSGSQVFHTDVASYRNTITQFMTDIVAYPRHNLSSRYDVNDDGWVSPNDALIIINSINETGAILLNTSAPYAQRAPFVDVNKDNYLSPIDALQVINELISHGPRPIFLPNGLQSARPMEARYTSSDVSSANEGNWNPAISRTVPLARSLDSTYRFTGSYLSGGVRYLTSSVGYQFTLSRTGQLRRRVTMNGQTVSIHVANLLPAHYSNPALIVSP